MKSVKILTWIVALTVIVLAAGIYYVVTNIDSIVERGIETVGPRVTGTDVDVKSVNVTLRDGKAELKGFSIANPHGFSNAKLLSANVLAVQIEPSSIRSDVIVLNAVTIDGVQLRAEQKGLGSNIQTVLKTIKSNIPEARDDAAAQEGAELQFMVESLTFTDGSLELQTEKYGAYTLEMPAVQLNNLGSREQGLTAEQLAAAILEPYLEKAKREAQRRLKEAAAGEIKSEAKEKIGEKLGEDAQESLKGLKGLLD